jgi:diguanylate cyclase (GGDEF)-like protein
MSPLRSFGRRRGKWAYVVLGFVVGPIIGLIDYVTGYEIAFSLFYLAPISLVAWLAGRPLGFLVSALSALTWLAADVGAGHSYSRLGIYFWNTLIRLGFFVVVVLLITALRRALEHERELSRVDDLTGAVNSRFFLSLVEMEIARARRHGRPFTIAYIDIDDFKRVNDRFGHSGGDRLLRAVAQCSRGVLRETDVFARLGGDEFAILLPETNREAAPVIISKIRDGLQVEMRRGDWPVTFSIGALTCVGAPSTTDEIIKVADDLMYSVKRDGKNGIAYSACGE